MTPEEAVVILGGRCHRWIYGWFVCPYSADVLGPPNEGHQYVVLTAFEAVAIAEKYLTFAE